MADMKDFMYRQKVSEDELDGAYAGLETADLNLVNDLDFAARDNPDPNAKADFGGIMWGWDIGILGGMELSIAAGAGYDEDGKRVATVETLILDTAQDGYTAIGAAGTPTGSTTDPGVGQERWLSIFLVFDRALSDGRYDGYNNLVYFDRKESFKFRVKAGTTGAIGSNPARPARELGELLLDDVLVRNSAGTPVVNSIDLTPATRRREYFFDYTATNAPLAPLGSARKEIKGKGNVRDVLVAMLELYNDHIGGHADPHPGLHLPWTAAGRTWADGAAGSAGVAATVSDALWGIMDDLRQNQPAGGGRAGSASIGCEAIPESVYTPTPATPLAIAQDSLNENLAHIHQAVNGRIFRGGDDGIAGALVPASDGIELGDLGGNRWDVYARNLWTNRVTSGLIPTGTQVLGDASNAWGALHANWANLPRLDSGFYYFDFIADANPSDGTIRLQMKSDETEAGITINPRNGPASPLTTGDKCYFELGDGPEDNIGFYAEKELVVGGGSNDQYRCGMGKTSSPATPDGLFYRGGGDSSHQNNRGAYLDEDGATYRYEGTSWIQSAKLIPMIDGAATDVLPLVAGSGPWGFFEDSSSPFEHNWLITHDTSDRGDRLCFVIRDLPHGAWINKVGIYWTTNWSMPMTLHMRAALFRKRFNSAIPTISHTEFTGPHYWSAPGNYVKTYDEFTVAWPTFSNWDPRVDNFMVQIAPGTETSGGTDYVFGVVVFFQYLQADPNFPPL
jgi:hypothetical protein